MDKIEGIGKAKKVQLIKQFKSVANIKKASVADLCKVNGISVGIAERIYAHFHSRKD
ncbi:MAG: helix-hairpin-helix domain-containing protein [Clostridia bacterium]